MLVGGKTYPSYYDDNVIRRSERRARSFAHVFFVDGGHPPKVCSIRHCEHNSTKTMFGVYAIYILIYFNMLYA